MTQFCMTFFHSAHPSPSAAGHGVQDWCGVDKEENSEMEHLHFKKKLRDMVQLQSCYENGSESLSKSYYNLSKLIFVECFIVLKHILLF